MTVVALAPSCSSDDGLAGSIEFIDCGSDAAISFFYPVRLFRTADYKYTDK